MKFINGIFSILITMGSSASLQTQRMPAKDRVDLYPTSVSMQEAEAMPLAKLEALYLKERSDKHANMDLLAPRKKSPLTIAEQTVIQVYTRDNVIENLRIFIAAVEKIPKSKGTFYRGTGDLNFHLDPVERVTSVSTKRRIAESFVDHKGAILVLKTASARNLKAYTVIDEGEHILLPGVRFDVQNAKTSEATVQFGDEKNRFTVPLMEISERGLK